jgi:hypothetical protein
MRAITTSQHEPEVQRDEREAEPLVLLDVPSFVQPEGIAWLARADDDVSERDRRVATQRDEDVREAPVGDVQEAAVADSRQRERQQPDEMAEWIRVMSGEYADEVS